MSEDVKVAQAVYEAAVKGRQDFRNAYRNLLPVLRAAEGIVAIWRAKGRTVDPTEYWDAINAIDVAVTGGGAKPDAEHLTRTAANADVDSTPADELADKLAYAAFEAWPPSDTPAKIWDNRYKAKLELAAFVQNNLLAILSALRSQPPSDAIRKPVCANCEGLLGDLAPGRDPEELCDTCYEDSQASVRALAQDNHIKGQDNAG